MMRLTLVASILAAAACSGACGTSPGEPGAPPPPPSSPERALCLAPVTGDTAVDATLRERQATVAHLPNKMDAWVVLGRAWVEKARNSGDPGFYVHADACAKEVLTHEPGNVLALGLRSLALLNDHKFVDAKALADEMLQKDRDDLTAWGALSDAELELGNIDAAEKAAQEMMDRKPSLPSYTRASYLKWLRGDEAGALEAIRLAIDAGRGQKDHEPEAWVLSEAANIFWLRGDVDGALAGYEQSLAEKSDEAPALVGKARCLIAQGKAGEAVPLLEKAFEATHLVETAWWLSRAHALLGDEVKARAWLDKAVDAGKEGDKRSQALVLASVNQYIDTAKKAIDDDNAHRGGPYADDVAALVAWRAGDMATALAKSADAVKLGTPDPRLWLHRGVILATSGAAAGASGAGAASDVKTGKKLVADALAKGGRFDPALVALAKEAGVEVNVKVAR